MENHQLNSITFALPARQFEISASVTVNETLPKVNEFVLRLIKVCGGIEGEEVARYFGFSGKETRLVLDSLKDQSLIRMDGELYKLTEYAESKFYTEDDIPRFSVVKPRTDIIDFDLLTFNPVAGRIRNKPAAFLVEIPCEGDRIGSSGRLAEQAYQKNFKKILRDKERTKDVIDIYKISGVKSKKLFEIPLEVRFTLSERNEVERIIDYDEDATEDFRLAVEAAVSDVLQTEEADQNRWFADFVEYFDDPVLEKYITRHGFDFEKYVREVVDGLSEQYSGSRTPILGNLYMPNNQALVLRALSVALAPVASELNFVSGVWMAPDYSFWGRSALLDDFYAKLRELIPQPKKKSEEPAEDLLILYPGLRETKWLLERQLWSKPAKNIHFYSGDVMGGRVEILFFPTSFACVLFHYRPPGNSMALIPIGFFTCDPLIIEKAKRLIGLAAGSRDAYVGAASFDKTKQPKIASFSEVFGFLNYSPIGGEMRNHPFGVPVVSQRQSSVIRPTSRNVPDNQKDQSRHFTEKHTAGSETNGIAKNLATKLTLEETDDQIIFRSGSHGGAMFKVSKGLQWRGLLPLPSIDSRAVIELADRVGQDHRKLRDELSVMKKYVRDLTPSEAAKRLSEELGIPVAEIWRYFIDAMYVLER